MGGHSWEVYLGIGVSSHSALLKGPEAGSVTGPDHASDPGFDGRVGDTFSP